MERPNISKGKKIIASLLVAVMIICAVPINGSIDLTDWLSFEVSAADSKYDAVTEYMSGLLNDVDTLYNTDDEGNTYIELVVYTEDIKIDSAEFSDVYYAFRDNYPTQFAILDLFVCSGFSAVVGEGKEKTEYIYSYVFTDGVQKIEDYNELYTNLKAVVDDIMLDVADLSDFETISYLHDYIALSSYYDTTYSIFDAYIVLLDGYGVCQAYSYAYQILLTEAGINCLYVTSTAMNHGWSLVELDGEWYHVDITYDDPNFFNTTEVDAGLESGAVGRVARTYFLLNDAEMYALRSVSWSAEYESTSTTYSDMPRNTNIIQVLQDDTWYYYDNGDLYSCDQYGYNIELVSDTMGNGLEIYDGRFYYGVGSSIVSQSISDSDDIVTIFTLDNSSYKYFTFFVQGDYLYYYYDYYYNIKYLSSDYSYNVALLTTTAIECDEPIYLASINFEEDFKDDTTAPAITEPEEEVVVDDVHVHEYVTSSFEATCTADAYTITTCKTCNYYSKVTSEKTATGHDYDDGVVTDPTCTADGYTTYTCSVCQYSYKVDGVVSSGHSYIETITTDPTCTEKGYATYECRYCGDSFSTAIPATGHTFVEGYCEDCGLSEALYTCTCACHSTGFDKGWFNFLNFFRKIFNMTQYEYCGCGAYHW